MTITHIKIVGAKEHNLKNISVEIPRDKLVIITGLSGSGKSSLTFDTIYAEGQRRYVESLSAYARQFLEMMQKPNVDKIEGLSPSISIEQKTTSKNPRSTVGTITEIYDYMRLLWARIGIAYSPTTGKAITSQTINQMVDAILDINEGTKVLILAPVVRGRKGAFKKEFANYRALGFIRAQINNEIKDLAQIIQLDKKYQHDIDIIVDRIIVKKQDKARYSESIETALKLTDGLCVLQIVTSPKDSKADAKKIKTTDRIAFNNRILLSSNFACPVSGFTIEEIEPRLFSFNSPTGACQSCEGLGNIKTFAEDMLIPNKSLSISQGAIYPWSKGSSTYYPQILEAICKHDKIPMDKAWCDLSKKQRQRILYGTEKELVTFIFEHDKHKHQSKKPFEGVINNFIRRYSETESQWVRDELEKYQTSQTCQACNGLRLNEQALCVKIDNQHIMSVTQLPIDELLNYFKNLSKKLSTKQQQISERILKEICDRLSFLNSVGLAYLSLSRSSGTLSGGESQRIRLASQIGSGLTGVLYVLDEPSIGLHQRDNDRLIQSLRNLVGLGNSVLVVEHDEDTIRSADYILDIGPGAGVHGGEVIYAGSIDGLLKCKKSLTADYLSGRKIIAHNYLPRKIDLTNSLKIIGASGNNLKNIDVEIPLKCLVTVTGVSGSGKSSLILATLYKSLAKTINKSSVVAAPHKKIVGTELIDKIIEIDQSPIGRTPRSNPATYTGAFTPIREWFANLPEAKNRGFSISRFSFNVKGGRCEACHGDGVIKIEMHFLPDIFVTCDDCHGARYNRETLNVTFRGKSISDVLHMTIEDGIEFFKAIPSIFDKLNTLNQVGLGYIKIGQQANTLSGGEAQRVKLAKELSKRATGKTLYILDEPTTGLHFEDINNLMKIIHKLIDNGNSVIIIEHNLDVIKQSDYVIDLGIGGGKHGGKIVFKGTVAKLLKDKKSITGQYLQAHIIREQDKNK